jgi:hypothetical protein
MTSKITGKGNHNLALVWTWGWDAGQDGERQAEQLPRRPGEGSPPVPGITLKLLLSRVRERIDFALIFVDRKDDIFL